jgi:hypothetical protein
MSNAVGVQVAVVSKEEMVGRLAHYLEQQPESVRASNKWLKRLEAASLVLPLAALVAAIVLIVTSGAALWQSIPAAVFAVWGCLAPCIFLVGLHSVLIRAFPPVGVLMAAQTKSPGFFTGSTAVGMGAFIMVAAMFFAACCAMGAYAFFNPDILEILIPVIIVFSVGSGLCGTWLRKQRWS